MKLRVFIILAILVFSCIPSSASISEFIDEDFTFRIKETADYTNHLDDTMLISVEGNKEIAYSFVDFGGDQARDQWISGVLQVEVEKDVSIGHLNFSGFDAKEGGIKSASVSSFNFTLVNPSNYSSRVTIIPMAFLTSHNTNVTLVDNSTQSTVFIGLDQPNFVLDESIWVQALESYFLNFESQIESTTELEITLEKGSQSFSYSVEGQMEDIHQFTYHERKLRNPADYNIIDISGGISISYSGDGVLSEYTAQYDISYGDIRILQYQYTITVGSGSIGNIQVGDAGLFPSFNLQIVLLGLLILTPVVLLLRSRREN